MLLDLSRKLAGVVITKPTVVGIVATAVVTTGAFSFRLKHKTKTYLLNSSQKQVLNKNNRERQPKKEAKNNGAKGKVLGNKTTYTTKINHNIPLSASSSQKKTSSEQNTNHPPVAAVGGTSTSEKSQTTNTTTKSSSPQATPTPAPSFYFAQSNPTPTPTKPPTTTQLPTPTPTSTPMLDPTSTPTPTPVPTETKETMLFPYNSAVPNADGKITITAKKYEHGYWDFVISGSFRFLQPRKIYQLWLCGTEGTGCSSHTDAKFMTDENGNASLANMTIHYPQGKYPLDKIVVWEAETAENEIPQDKNNCYPNTGASPCLEGSIHF